MVQEVFKQQKLSQQKINLQPPKNNIQHTKLKLSRRGTRRQQPPADYDNSNDTNGDQKLQHLVKNKTKNYTQIDAEFDIQT